MTSELPSALLGSRIRTRGPVGAIAVIGAIGAIETQDIEEEQTDEKHETLNSNDEMYEGIHHIAIA